MTMQLKDVSKKLRGIGLLESQEIRVWLIQRKEGPSPIGGNGMGHFKAKVSPEGEVNVTEMHIDPDMAEQVKAQFADTDVKVEEMPWV